jgi:hypothetical protein
MRVAKERFRTNEFSIVAVGNPKEFGKPLSNLKIPVHKLDLTIPPPKAEVGTDQGDGPGVLKRAQQAMGGRAALEAVKDIETTVEIRFQMGASMSPGKQKTQRVFPDVMRQEQDLPFGRIVVFSDGRGGWLKSPQGMQGLPPAVGQQVRQEMFRSLTRLVLSDGMATRTVQGLGDGLTAEISDREGNRAKLQLDAATGLPWKLSYSTTPLTGAPSEVVETYGAWKSVNQMMLPFEYTIDQAGKRFAEAKVSGYRINTGVTVEDLGKKP